MLPGTKTPHHGKIQIGRVKVPVVIRRNARAKHVTLRVDVKTRKVCVTLPRYTSFENALRFMQDHEDWILAHWQDVQIAVPLEHGSTIPVLGHRWRIAHDPERRHGWEEVGHTVYIGGTVEMVPMRVKRWIKHKLQEEIDARLPKITAKLGKKTRKITIRDMNSRWGSCNSRGDMAFSWRLAFAPPEVFNYILCHEAAHLRVMNHSPRFWAVVKEICPSYARHRDWLNEHGKELYKYG